MRILTWTEFYWPSVGGGELFTRNLLRGLRRRGHEFAVVSGRLTDEVAPLDRVDGITVHRFPFRPVLARRDVAALARIRGEVSDLVRAFRPDLLHMTWMGPCGVVYEHLQRERPLPTLITLGQHLHGEVGGGSLRGTLLRGAAWVAACARWMRRALLARLPELSARSSVVFHAVPPAPGGAAAFPVRPQLLCLGRLVASKGFDLALRALPAIAARHPEARLVVAGEGPHRPALEALAAELGIGGRVEFLGRAHPEDTAALIDASTLVLMPSHEETFGLVALEAGQRERPLVASRVEGLAEIVAHQETGVLVPPGDAAALARAAIALLDDPERCARLGRYARQRVAEQFSWERHLDAYEALYRRLGQHAPA